MSEVDDKPVRVDGADYNLMKTCPSHDNIPQNLDQILIHRTNLKIYGLPVPRRGQVLGLVGTDFYGKKEIFNILSGRSIPNFGRVHNPPDWQEVLTYFEEGSDLYNYFTRIGIDKAKVLRTPDRIYRVPFGDSLTVSEILDRKDKRGMKAIICSELELNHILDRKLTDHLSLGELQRFAIGRVALDDAEVYIFDEPSNFLDVKQRIKAAQVILSVSLSRPDSYVIVADHDTSVLDYVSDFVCCLYRLRNSCQLVTLPFSVREGINMYLDGFVANHNIRFRKESLAFEQVTETLEEVQPSAGSKYRSMSITREGFKLMVNEGEFTKNQIIVILGERGTGKSTFMRIMAGRLNPDTVGGSGVPLSVSFKPQLLKSKYDDSVETHLYAKIGDACQDPLFRSDVMEPLQIMELMNRKLTLLSALELHKVVLCLCLGKPADIYLIDEPTACIDIEDIMAAAKVIKRFIRRTKKTAFVVDHNLMLVTYLADKVIVFEGIASVDCIANPPESLYTGMNRYLSHLDISCQQDPINGLPVINRMNSDQDRKQKAAGQYYLDSV